jgi:starch phosphorylase
LPLEPPAERHSEAESIYNKLEGSILPTYYNDRRKFIEIMQHAIAVNGSYFNTQRMVQDYTANAYIR